MTPYRLPVPGFGLRHVTITARQADVLDGLARGDSYEEMARAMHLTRDSVATHLRRLYRALDARNGPHAVALVLSGQVRVTVDDKYDMRRAA